MATRLKEESTTPRRSRPKMDEKSAMDECPSYRERSHVICVCSDCLQGYLSDFEKNKGSVTLPTSNQTCEEKKDCVDIDENLHMNLHILWIGQFVQLFAPLTMQTGILWYLRPLDVDEKVFHEAIWRSTVKAKVRFECESCQHIWTSMMGTAVFSVHPSATTANAFELCFTLLGQSCSNCDSKVFQSAIWYPEEVIRVLNYVYWQICDELFGINVSAQVAGSNALAVNKPDETLSRPRRALKAVRNACRSVSLAGNRQKPLIQSLLTSRSGQPLRKHFSHQCEACLRGVCSANETAEDRSGVTDSSQTAPRFRLRHRNRFLHRRGHGTARKSERATSVTPEAKDGANDTRSIEGGMAQLCLKMPTWCTKFGSALPARKRPMVIFRSLRDHDSNKENRARMALKRWKSADDLAAASPVVEISV